MGIFKDIKNQYMIKENDVEQLVYEYLAAATEIYLTQCETGKSDDAGLLKLNILRKQIISSASKTNPVELSELYTQLMSSNMPRIKAAEYFDRTTREIDCAVWKSDAHAFLDIIGIIGDRRYDFSDASFIENGKLVIDNPIDMIEELADYATHNERVKRTAIQNNELSATILDMKNNIDASISDMTSEELEQFKRHFGLRKVFFDNALYIHMNDTEYCNFIDISAVSPLVRGVMSLLLSLQKEYNTDMIRKYSDRKYGLIPYVNNIDEKVDNAILGL